MDVTCGWCGEELDRLGSDHTCEKGMRVAAAIATGSPDPILNDE